MIVLYDIFVYTVKTSYMCSPYVILYNCIQAMYKTRVVDKSLVNPLKIKMVYARHTYIISTNSHQVLNSYFFIFVSVELCLVCSPLSTFQNTYVTLMINIHSYVFTSKRHPIHVLETESELHQDIPPIQTMHCINELCIDTTRSCYKWIKSKHLQYHLSVSVTIWNHM